MELQKLLQMLLISGSAGVLVTSAITEERKIEQAQVADTYQTPTQLAQILAVVQITGV